MRVAIYFLATNSSETKKSYAKLLKNSCYSHGVGVTG